MRLNVTLYRLMAYVTGVVLIVLCVLAVLQPFAPVSGAVSVVGTTHGALYIVYLLVAFPLTRRLRLGVWQTASVLLAGTIPVMTFVVERHISRTYIGPALAGATAGRASGAPDEVRGAEAVPPPAR